MVNHSGVYFNIAWLPTGAICISKTLEINNTLQALWMGFNNIGDNGITAIAGTLDKSQIRILDVRECGITDAGASRSFIHQPEY